MTDMPEPKVKYTKITKMFLLIALLFEGSTRSSGISDWFV